MGTLTIGFMEEVNNFLNALHLLFIIKHYNIDSIIVPKLQKNRKENKKKLFHSFTAEIQIQVVWFQRLHS